MGRKRVDSGLGRCTFLILLLVALLCCSMLYLGFSMAFRARVKSMVGKAGSIKEGLEREDGECCKGIEHLEIWGSVVKWGKKFKVNSTEDCCKACKKICHVDDGPCLCDSWVFCGDREACGSQFGQCWLKRQKDAFEPDQKNSGGNVMWTSGFIYGKGEGIVGLKTDYGTLRIKLFPDCAPHSVTYILELLASRYCVGCEFYRAESRGSSWDAEGNHIENAPFGPPSALIQGTLEAHSILFEKIPSEDCPTIRRGSVAWVGSGPEFFISLANHYEWRKAYTVFGSVLPEDLEIAERISHLPTSSELWGNVNVSVLKKPVPLRFQRIMTQVLKT